MNYSSYPIQSRNSKMNLMYNSKKNIKKKPLAKVSKNINNRNNIQNSLEHFSNANKRKNRTSTKDNSNKEEPNLNKKEESSPDKKNESQIIYMDNDKDDDDNPESEQPTSETSKSKPELETPPPKTFLSKLISGILSIVFLALIGFIIYAGYMYFIKKKNIFSTINFNSQNPNSETLVESLSQVDSTPQSPITEPQINSSNMMESSNKIEALSQVQTDMGNNNLEIPNRESMPEKVFPSLNQANVESAPQMTSTLNPNTQALGGSEDSIVNESEFEMTGGKNDMVSDIINILQKFQH